MSPNPIKPIVSDYYATIKTSGAVMKPTLRASLVSEMEEHLIGVIPKGEKLPLWLNMLQHLPIVGRLFAHFPGE